MTSPMALFAIPSLRRLSPLFALLLALMVSGCGINNIPTFEEQAKAKWSDVQNQYQRRADLIPNLVETVKGYAAHEKDVLEGVVKARAAAVAPSAGPEVLNDPAKFKEYEQRQMELSGALGRLLAIVENYPDLKANQNFLALQSQLEGTENRISVARRDYIAAFQDYNTELTTFPGRIWRSVMYSSAQPLATFDIPPQETQTPRVDFGTKK